MNKEELLIEILDSLKDMQLTIMELINKIKANL
jgi:hypothetical protein